MIAVVTEDQFLYFGIKATLPGREVVRFDKISTFIKENIKPDTLIIDLLCGEGLNLKRAKILETVESGKVFIFSSFKTSRMQPVSPVYYIDRKIPPKHVSDAVVNPDAIESIKTPSFSVTQIEVARLAHTLCDDKKIANQLDITQETLRIHKYNLMLKLKLRKMCHIINTEFYKHICD